MKTKPRSIKELVEERVKEWGTVPHSEKKKRRKPLLLISREAGTIAEEVARRLSKELEMHLYDEDLVSRIAEDTHTSETIVRSLDEKGVSFIDDLLEGLAHELTSDEYAQDLFRTLGTIDWHGNGVILGRGAAFFLRGRNNLLVRFVAPQEERIKNVMATEGLNESEARARVEKLDKDRRAFVHKYFHEDIDDVKKFDLVFNSANMDVDTVVQILKVALRRTGFSS